ncbi:MAG: hypothetical protein M0Q13_13565 [Methanothrix sp.]|jgi:hypothetical protein|nr:hypothetical protein [Methanothrix sp.]
MGSKYNLAGRRKLIPILFLIVSLPPIIFGSAINEAIQENNRLLQGQNHSVVVPIDLDNAPFYKEGTKPDLRLVLTMRPLKGFPTVDEKVEIYGKAILREEYPNVDSITIHIENAMKYPIDDRTLEESPDLFLDRVADTNIFIGNTTSVWTMEGTYRPYWLLIGSENATLKGPIGPLTTANLVQGVLITVYPKSQFVQIISNQAMLYLTIIIYFATVVGLIPMGLNLWASPPTERRDTNNDTTNASKTRHIKKSRADYNTRAKFRITKNRPCDETNTSHSQKTGYRK